MQYQVDPTDQTRENGQKPLFWLFWWLKNAFLGFLNDPSWHVRLPNVGKHLVLSQYAISSRSKRPNPRKWPKTSFLAIWIIQKCIFVIFEWTFMTWQDSQMLRNNLYNHNMQYQVHPSCQNRENGPNLSFSHFSSKNF